MLFYGVQKVNTFSTFFYKNFPITGTSSKTFPSYRLCAAAVFRTNLFKSPFSLASTNTKWCIHKGLHRTQIPVKGKVCLRHLWRCCDSDSPHNSLTRLDLGTKGCHFALHPFTGCRLELHPYSVPHLWGNFARSGKTSILQFNHSIVKRYRVTELNNKTLPSYPDPQNGNVPTCWHE